MSCWSMAGGGKMSLSDSPCVLTAWHVNAAKYRWSGKWNDAWFISCCKSST